MNEIWSITPSFIENNNIAENEAESDGVNCLTSLTIENIMPTNVSAISANDLISLAKDCREARKSLREHIGSVIDRMQTIESEEQANDELIELKEEIERDKAEFRKSQIFWNSDDFTYD